MRSFAKAVRPFDIVIVYTIFKKVKSRKSRIHKETLAGSYPMALDPSYAEALQWVMAKTT